jgi:hypothetical protein
VIETLWYWLLGCFVCLFLAAAATPNPNHTAATLGGAGVLAAIWTLLVLAFTFSGAERQIRREQRETRNRQETL